MSEAELHSLRLRLDSERLSKAKRGELVHHLPTGLARAKDGSVILDPNIAVQDRIRLVFAQFQELGSVSKVLRYLVRNNLQLPRHQTSGLYAGEVIWKDASLSALYTIMKNPAYAGAFAYGRRCAEPTKQIPGRPASGRIRRPQAEWLALVKDLYPAYISWDEYQRNQERITQNRQKMDEKFMSRVNIRKGAALLCGIIFCARCGHQMQVVYTKKAFKYKCDSRRRRFAKKSCQFVTGPPIDQVVVEEFFRALEPAQLDILDSVLAKQRSHQLEQRKHLEQEVVRLQYAAARAERQYDCVDPENRLIAATLEKKWEAAMAELEQSKATLATFATEPCQEEKIPNELRAWFANLGHELPNLWPKLSNEAKKEMLRTLVKQVNLERNEEGVANVRIVWSGGLVSQVNIPVPVLSLRNSKTEAKTVARLRQLTDAGYTTTQIVDALNSEEFRACRCGPFTVQIVMQLKRQYNIISPIAELRRGKLQSPAYTVSDLADILKVDPSWIYRNIASGRIRIAKDSRYQCYLFPRQHETIEKLQRLKKQEVPHVSFEEPYYNG